MSQMQNRLRVRVEAIEFPYPNLVNTYLDAHRLVIFSHRNGEPYELRRNGQTKRWKRDSRVSIPVKVGFRECFRIEWDTCGNYCTGERLGVICHD